MVPGPARHGRHGDHGLWRALQAKTKAEAGARGRSMGIGRGGLDAKTALAWAVVGIPLAWDVWVALEKSIIIFR